MTTAEGRELVAAIHAGGVLDSLKAAVELRRRGRLGSERVWLLHLLGHGDELARMTAGYALGRQRGVAVDRALLSLLESDDSTLREAASLAFAERRCWAPAVHGLCREATAGGFSGMISPPAWPSARPRTLSVRLAPAPGSSRRGGRGEAPAACGQHERRAPTHRDHRPSAAGP